MKNAVIESASLSSEDHGILSVWLNLDYGGSGQGFGGYCLYNPNFPAKDCSGRFIWRCLEIAGVTQWKDLPGKTIRVKTEGEFGPIVSIGHVIKDDWFCPATDLTKGIK